MKRTPFDADWTFGPKLGAFEALDGGAQRATVTIPHDAMRDAPRSPDSDQGVHTGYHAGGVFEYAATFDAPVEWRAKTVMLDFEGVYRDAVVFVNGEFAAHEANGYNAFTVTLDPFLRFGEANIVTVEARAHKDSRWYSGAGIYRPVHLVVADPVHLALDGVVVTTPDIDDERAIVEVSSVVENDTRHLAVGRVDWRILNPAGTTVAGGTSPVSALPGEPAVARVRLAVDDPELWHPDAANLYRLETTLTVGGRVIDGDDTIFGIRRLQLDPRHGLRLNGHPVKLRGACVHHDNGVLGAATIAAAEDRRVRLLKAAGFNALRSSHNPMSRAMLDACDRYGMLVMDELTDVWTRSKTAFDGSPTFPDRWRRDVAGLVRSDRNHPSVIMYSIGNEILELATPAGRAWGRRLAEAFRELDPTRFVTNGINGIIANLDRMSDAMAEGEASDPNTMMANMGDRMALMNSSPLVSDSIEEAAAVLDIVGFNYADSRYEADAHDHPNRVIVGSETFPSRIDRSWALVDKLPHVIGDFTWTGWDYLGEAGIGRVDYTDVDGYAPTGTAGPYPYVLAESGDLDITGHRRTVSYYRETVFGLRSEPAIAVHRPQNHGRPTATTPWSWDDTVSSWAWTVEPGSPVVVDVYADADEVELVLNGTTIGREPVGGPRAFVARFETVWRPGALTAVAYRRGVEIGRSTLRSTSGEVRTAVRAEEAVVDADGLAFVHVTLEDAGGTVVAGDDREVTVTVTGAAVLAGLGTGRARTEERFAASSVTTYDGRALAVLRPTAAGEATVTVESPGSPSVSVVVGVRP